MVWWQKWQIHIIWKDKKMRTLTYNTAGETGREIYTVSIPRENYIPSQWKLWLVGQILHISKIPDQTQGELSMHNSL